MKSSSYVIVFFLILSLANFSCYAPRYVFTPSTQNIPLLHKKGDLEFAAYNGGSINTFNGKGNYNRGFDLQGAWAVSNHVAAMVNETGRKENNMDNDSYYAGDTSALSYKSHFTEVGVGYFTPARDNKKMQLQIFGGAAFGSSDIVDEYSSGSVQAVKYHNSSVTKIFLQPAVVYNPVKNFSAALTSRFTEVIFRNINTNYTAAELNNYLLDQLTISPVFFWEPAMSYTFGFKKIPFQLKMQGSISILLNHRFVEHRTGNVAFGIVANVGKKEKKKGTKTKK